MSEITVDVIHENLKRVGGYGGIYVPEFTFGDKRADAAIINLKKRWVRCFEIKVNRSDWVQDKKWTTYSEFCSSLAVVCPGGLIQPEEISKPFGLLWVQQGKYGIELKWKKKAQNFQKRDSLAWLYTYVKVIEQEFPRIYSQNEQFKKQV